MYYWCFQSTLWCFMYRTVLYIKTSQCSTVLSCAVLYCMVLLLTSVWSYVYYCFQEICCFLDVVLKRLISFSLMNGYPWQQMDGCNCIQHSLETKRLKCMSSIVSRNKGVWSGSGYAREEHTYSLLGRFVPQFYIWNVYTKQQIL